MSAILRVSGKKNDIEDFLKDSNLNPYKVFSAGDPVHPQSAPNGRKITKSGFNISVSDIDFDDYQGQFREAAAFLQEHEDELRRLVQCPNIDSLNIDFGADIYPPGWCSFRFPHELLRLSGNLRINLELSIYPTDSENGKNSGVSKENLDEAYVEYKAQQENIENK